QDRIADLLAALARAAWREGYEHRQLERLLGDFAGDPGPAPLVSRRAAIDRCFAGETVEAILDLLSQEAVSGGPEAEWATKTRETLLTKSPTSLKITLRQLILGRGFALEEALALEYRLTQHVMAGHD